MKVWMEGTILLISFSVLVQQFYTASQKGVNSTTDVVVKGGSLAVLNQRHLVSLLAITAAILYLGFINSNGLLLHTIPNAKAVVVTVIAAVAAGTVSVNAARKALRRSQVIALPARSPEMYLLLRGLFLIAYELFFRGVLLTFCIAVTNVPVAIVLNVVLYALAHAFSTRQELLGTVPFGILLCLLTLYSGSVWPAVFIHLLLGLPYDVLILYAPKHITKTFSV